jgi:hypothetical protein
MMLGQRIVNSWLLPPLPDVTIGRLPSRRPGIGSRRRPTRHLHGQFTKESCRWLTLDGRNPQAAQTGWQLSRAR